MTSQELNMTDIEVLKAVRWMTKTSPYAGSFRTPEIGPKDMRVIDEVGREQEFGVVDVNQSLLKLVRYGFLIRMPEDRTIISNKGVEAIQTWRAKWG